MHALEVHKADEKKRPLKGFSGKKKKEPHWLSGSNQMSCKPLAIQTSVLCLENLNSIFWIHYYLVLPFIVICKLPFGGASRVSVVMIKDLNFNKRFWI